MKTAWIDPVGGLAGDMLVAALIDAGAPEADVLAAVATLGMEGWTARTEKVWRGPFHATRFVVELAGESGATPHDPSHDHEHGHEHVHEHGHGHEHRHPPAHEPSVAHDGTAPPHAPAWRARSRRWADIRTLLEAAPLAERVRSRVIAAFSRLADAEGRVHGMPAEAVTFHEVGAVDSIVDMVAACAALECLGIDTLVVGTIPLGTGHTLGEHGWIPLPAPATLECLRGLAVEGRNIQGETVTPTGAALVGALATSGPIPAMTVLQTGVGAGTWDPASHPNVVRVLIGEGNAGAPSVVAELRAEVDSLHPEAVPPLIEALLRAGALDAYVTPVLMKKGRPALLVTALAPPSHRVAVGEALLRHGSTLGYRWQTLAREVLSRRFERVRTAWGEVNVKLGEREGQVLHAAPEFEECAAIAAQHDLPVSQVIGAALAAWSSARR
ncbi:UPF0272 protein [Deltaproteobacteria bacterium]|nr:UPF0272 protein [Deltaproteobacteria bacterium]